MSKSNYPDYVDNKGQYYALGEGHSSFSRLKEKKKSHVNKWNRSRAPEQEGYSAQK